MRTRHVSSRGARRGGAWLVAMLLVALVGCTSDSKPKGSVQPSTSSSDSNASPAGRRTIQQPDVGAMKVGDQSKRVDLAVPKFSTPTKISNPLFPVSLQKSVLLLGTVDSQPFRTEVTLLPETRIIAWSGQQVETLVSQYVAYLGGRLHEVAYDFYAQDDDGAVWYFGEDVFNFRDGLIVDTHGTWIAGKDGPAAMIMPGQPTAGQLYRPENIPGFVFEEVTVTKSDHTADGPFGPIPGSLVISEVHMDGSKEDKTFAPGYGEFYTAGGGDFEALALAIPTDAATSAAPAELATLTRETNKVAASAASKDWAAANASLRVVTAVWDAVRATQAPKLIAPLMTNSVKALSAAVSARNAVATRQQAINVARWSLDLRLRYEPASQIELGRFDLWLAQMQLDALAEDGGAVHGDFFSLDYIRDRIQQVVPGPQMQALNQQLEALLSAVADENFAEVGKLVAALRSAVSRITLPQG